jgi:dienelactone hydrolase
MVIGRGSVTLACSIVAVTLLTGCGGYDNEDKNVVGNNLIIDQGTFEPEVDLTRAQIQAALDAEAAKKGTTAQTALLGLKSYKISYKTTDNDGNEIIASGLITIPAISQEFMAGYKAQTGRDFSLSIVSDQHGTIFENSEAPSVAAELTHTPNDLAVAYSSVAAFMTIQPDYIGYGDSNATVHPYIMEKPSASVTVDMIEAAIAFADKAGLPINGQVFLSGYSEGGYATMAAAKEIQEHHPDIHLMAVAPMAGPYDLEKMALGALTAPMMAFPPFLADIAYAYASAYEDVDINDVINAPYAAMLPTLFDGKHDGAEIFMALPNIYTVGQEPDKLFKQTFIDDFLGNAQNPLRKHFVENSVVDWKPEMPMRLYHCTNDSIIPYTLSQLAKASFTEHGSKTVTLEPIDSVEANASNPLQVHRDCAPVAYSKVIPWFDKVRKGEK